MRTLLLALLLVPTAVFAGDHCDSGCTNAFGSGCGHSGCRSGCCKDDCGCADDYRCKLDVKGEDVEKDCYVVECVPVCIAPVTCNNNACNRNNGCSKCGSCGNTCDAESGYCDGCGTVNNCCDTGCCDAAGCDGSCDGAGCGDGCGKGLKGLLSRLCRDKGTSCGRIRMVNKLSSDSKPNGTKCSYKWSAEKKDGCSSCGHAGCNGNCCYSEGCVP